MEKIEIRLPQVKEFTFKCNGLYIEGPNFESELDDHGYNAEELAHELTLDLSAKLFIHLRTKYGEEKASKLIGKLVKEILENTIGA